jgi:L-alanine-DL-glutamate epimerase-like enolase superfamily enzyme
VKVTAVETVRHEEFPNIVHVLVHTDDGLVGLGETSFGAAAVEAYIHETAAPYLAGQDPLAIDRHWIGLRGFVGISGTGVENRGRSAIDLALWDLLGQVCNQPVWQLLGGASRDRIRTYNTCAGYRYVRNVAKGGGLPVGNWGTAGSAGGAGAAEGPYEDLDGFLHRAGEVAESLLEQGITGMKIWPFDIPAEATGGHGISTAEMKKALEPFAKIRHAVGDRMDVMVELHGLWDLPTAMRIAHALEDYDPFWFEDPIRMDNLDALRRFADSTPVPTTASETIGTRWGFRDLIERGGVSIVMFDPVWVGGISESRKIVAMAEAAQLPVAPHDCVGPVEFMAAIHLSINAPNALVQESVRAFYTGWYNELVTVVPQVVDGCLAAPQGIGLGTELLPEVLDGPGAIRRVTAES